jgi:hypothetical protein
LKDLRNYKTYPWVMALIVEQQLNVSGTEEVTDLLGARGPSHRRVILEGAMVFMISLSYSLTTLGSLLHFMSSFLDHLGLSPPLHELLP